MQPVVLRPAAFCRRRARDLRSGPLRRPARFVEIAGGKNIDAHDLELCRRRPSREHRTSIAGDGGGEHFALFEQRRDQAEDLPRCSDAFADRENVRVRSLHVVVDHDAAIHFESGLAAQFRVGADARGDHDEVGLQFFAAREAHAFDMAVAEQAFRRAAASSTRTPSSSILRFR